MFKDLRYKIAAFISPEREEYLKIHDEDLWEREKKIDYTVGARVADVLTKMDPFEPLLKKYNGIFTDEFTKPEDNLNEPMQIMLFSWAYSQVKDPSFTHLANWIRNTQGNATIRKANDDRQLFFGRAMVASITLWVEEIGRLSSRYEDIVLKKDQSFDAHLPVD